MRKSFIPLHSCWELRPPLQLPGNIHKDNSPSYRTFRSKKNLEVTSNLGSTLLQMIRTDTFPRLQVELTIIHMGLN